MRHLCFVTIVAFIFVAGPSVQACTPEVLSCGTTVTAHLGPGSACIKDSFPTGWYSFQASAGQTVTFRASTSSGQTIGLELLNGAGELLANRFDEPASITHTFAIGGTFYVSVNFGNPHASASYSLTVTCSTSGPPAPTTCSYTATLQSGDSVAGGLSYMDAACGDSRGYAKAYRLRVVEGEAFSVMYSATYPVELQIIGPTTADERSGTFRRSTGTSLSTAYVAPRTGDVTLWVASNTTTPVSGSFSLKLDPLTLPSCGKIRAVRH
jgi:hypothetical protein